MSQPLNVGGLPNNPKVVQQISQQIEGRNLGVDKIILNINGGNSELETNNNSILKYSLKQPIQLEPGDTVTCINAFVEEQGLQSNTISIEEDISTEMRFMYYKQGDCGDELSDCEDIGWCAYPRVFPDMVGGFKDPREYTAASWLALDGDSEDPKGESAIRYSVGDCMPNMDFSSAPQESVKAGTPGKSLDISTGCNGNYYYLVETVKYTKINNVGHEIQGNVPYFRPCYGKKTIVVKAGNYSVDSLANIISSQLNGSLGQGNNTFSDALMDKLYFPKTRPPNRKLFETIPYFSGIDTTSDIEEKDIIGANGTGEASGYERRIEGMVKQINYSQSSYFNCWCFQNIWSKTIFGVDQRDPTGGLEFTPPVQSLLRFENSNGAKAKFPNGTSPAQFPPTANFNTDDYIMPIYPFASPVKTETNKAAPDAIQLTTADPVLSTNQSCHFYMNLAGLKRLFENTNKQFYSLPALANDIQAPTDNFYPPNVYEYLYSVNTSEQGYVKNYIEDESLNGDVRFAGGRAALGNQLLCPVNGLTYPGKDSLGTSRQKFAGTTVAEVTFGDQVDNRFAISNLHEFYKLPSLSADGKSPTGYGGQQATKLNNPFYQGLVDNPKRPLGPGDKPFITSGAIIASAAVDNASAVYPVDSTSGIVINNFSFELVKDTDIYKDSVAQIQTIDGATGTVSQLLLKEKLIYDLLTKTFSEFFPTETAAKDAWSKSLWSRLGFGYNQLGNIKENLETITEVGNPDKTVVHKGLITHNSFDLSKIVSSDGLGTGSPDTTAKKNSAGVPMQNYRLNSYYVGKQLTGNYGANGNNIHLLGDSKPITASKLPSLNAGKSYLIIESDIVKPNFKDTKANWGNLLAIMSKENASNDTIFGASPIDFTITEPKLLTDITIYIKNPDGTLADNSVVGKNNAFIIQIQKAINPTQLPTLTI